MKKRPDDVELLLEGGVRKSEDISNENTENRYSVIFRLLNNYVII